MGEPLRVRNAPQWLVDHAARCIVPLDPPPKTSLDIGANIGAWTDQVLRRWPNTRVRCFEPEGALARQLGASFNGQVDVFAAALVADKKFNRLFFAEDNSWGTRTVSRRFARSKRSEKISVVPIRETVASELVKVDIEGHELDLLRAAPPAWFKPIRALVVEYHRYAFIPALRKILEQRGFDLWQHVRVSNENGVLKFIRSGERITERRPFIAVPCHRAPNGFFVQSILRCIAAQVGFQIRFNFGDSLVTRARNTLTADFLESDATHLLFIDDDLIFGPDHVRRITSHPVPIVGGLYPKKQDGPTSWVLNTLTNSDPSDRSDGLTRVAYIGTGFLCVERSVFERMIERFPEIEYLADESGRREWDFWSVGVCRTHSGQVRYLSEDWFFCERALQMGYQIFADPAVVLKHVGDAIYPLKSQESELFSRAAAARRRTRVSRARPAARPVSRARQIVVRADNPNAY
jgi:FkbM family methyltransferase